MFSPHPNLSDEINAKIGESELSGGVRIRDLPVGSTVKFQTRGSLYLLEKRADGDYLSGNPHYVPVPTKVNVHGSTWGGSMLKLGYIGIGMHVEFSINGKTVLTSEVLDVRVEEA